MATVVGSLVAKLGVDSAKFRADMGKAQKLVSSSSAKMNRSLGRLQRGFMKLSSGVKGVLKRMFSFRGIVAQLIGAGGLGLLIKKSLDAADAIAKLADETGLTTDQIQSYQFAARLAGVDTQKFNRALSIFSKRIGEVQTRGAGPLASGLKGYNDELLKALANTKNQDEALKIMADAMQDAGSATERSALANAGFSTSTLEIVNLLSQGSEGLVRMQNRARELGIVIDEKMIRQAETAGDKFEILSTVLRTKLISAVLANVDKIIALADSIGKAIPKIVKFIEVIGRSIGKLMEWGEALGATTRAVSRLINGLDEGSLSEVNRELDKVSVKIIDIKKSLERGEPNAFSRMLGFDEGDLRRDLDKLVQEKVRLEAIRRRLKAQARPNVTDLSFGDKPVTKSGDIEPASKKPPVNSKAFLDRAKMLREGAQKQVAPALEAIKTKSEKFSESVSKLNHQLEIGVLTQDQYDRRLHQLREELKSATDKTDEMEQSQSKLKDTIMELTDKAINGQIKGWRDLGRVALDVLQSIIEKQLELFTQSKNKGGITGQGMGGPVFGSANDVLGGIFGTVGNNIGGLFGFARGGSFEVGGSGGTDSQFVGFRASPGETVTVSPHGKEEGTTMVFNIDARGADQGVVERIQDALAQFSKNFNNMAVQAVVDRRRRDPRLFT